MNRYFKWVTEGIKVPFWGLVLIVEYATIGVCWHTKIVGKWFDIFDK